VVDASALIAWAGKEPGAVTIDSILSAALMGEGSYLEVQ
jgi:PIN domain nuclease of toxin-antitoxin system